MNLTLQNRITCLMIISSVIFISAFTFIQVNNQASNINRTNSYRTNLATMVTGHNLESIVKNSLPDDLPGYLQKNIEELKNTGIIQDLTVFDSEGKIIASTEGFSSEGQVSYRDIGKAMELKEACASGSRFISSLDPNKKKLFIYIPLSSNTEEAANIFAKISSPLTDIQDALKEVYRPVIIAILIVLLANLAFGYILSKTVIGPVKTLNQVTKIIASGDLTVRAKIATGDELEELGSTFNYMAEELIKMKEKAENANPLTKLPGNIVIHEEIDKRISGNRKFMVIYCDLDNFKAFNDKYGIAKGDEAIKLTSDVFKEAAKLKGNPDDFLGHEGGDDFILLTTPGKAQDIADYITKEFDRRVRTLYGQEDLSQGHIIAHARDGSIKQFPIMTISLAGVTNEIKPIKSYGEVTNIAAEVKKKAKAIEGSSFVIDKRLS